MIKTITSHTINNFT